MLSLGALFLCLNLLMFGEGVALLVGALDRIGRVCGMLTITFSVAGSISALELLVHH